jgi:hypothetical protein
MKRFLFLVRVKGFVFSLLLAAPAFAAQSKEILYQNDFEKADPGKVPSDMLVLDGAFGVKEEAGNHFLELPGAPLDTFGILFGPTEGPGLTVSARVYGTAKGRRFPTFAVGLLGVGGFKLQISPGKKLLELYKSDTVVASAPYSWESDCWTWLRLQTRKSGSSWKIEGKAWKQGTPEPDRWAISHEETEEPAAGRAALWGSPYSTTPIRYDDLIIKKSG